MRGTVLARVLSWAQGPRAGRTSIRASGAAGCTEALAPTRCGPPTTKRRSSAPRRLICICRCCSRCGPANGRATCLRLPWSAYDGTHIRLRQSKTGARVVDPGRRAAQGRARRHGQARRPSSSRTATASHGRRTASARRGGKACAAAGVIGVTFNDLRGTAVTRLALAGAPRRRSPPSPGTRSATCARSSMRTTCTAIRPRRERDPKARKGNENSQLSAQLV